MVHSSAKAVVASNKSPATIHLAVFMSFPFNSVRSATEIVAWQQRYALPVETRSLEVAYHSCHGSMSEEAMDRFTAMGLFVRIVETGSFSAVAREMNMTQPTVSKQLTALERQLKTRLLNRSTRQLSLTEAGSAYFESSKRIIDAVREADGNLGQLQTQLTGVLRINTSIGLGQVYLGPMVLRFQAQHPGLSIDLSYSDRFVDLVEEGIDVAIRIGKLNDSSLAARRIGSAARSVIATPAYLKKYGEPRVPQDLSSGHNC